MAKILPEGIDVEFGKTYEAMFSYKAKNYALLEIGGRMTIKGGALKSRGMEPFLRDYLRGMIRKLLEGKPAKAAAMEAEIRQMLEQRKIPIARLARAETLQDSPAAYLKKISASSRNRSAAFEIALKSGRSYVAGDQVRYYITGDKKKVTAYEAAKPLSEYDPAHPDENIAYYAGKLSELAGKFESFFPDPTRLL
jgi:DNA polymerase elongation subunit (family B)